MGSLVSVLEHRRRVVATEFEYRRVGYDSRRMTFLENGLVGTGSAACEVYWDLEQVGTNTFLRIFSDSALTCKCSQGADGVWRGRWLRFEQMPVELVPLAYDARNGTLDALEGATPQRVRDTSSGACGQTQVVPERIRLGILTVPRSPVYVHTTLASLFLSSPTVHRLLSIDVMIDTSDRRYLCEYQHHRVIRLHHLSKEDERNQATADLRTRSCYNYWRCLNVPLDGCRGLLVFEDDVLCRHRFLEKLLQVVTEMEVEHGVSRYVLSLGANYRLVDYRELHRGKYFVTFPAEWFYGTQATYFPATVVPEIRDYIWREGVVGGRTREPGAPRFAADLLIAQVGTRESFLYSTVRNLVDHIGAVSTGLGGCSRLPTFYEQWTPLTR
jgi:hypothetical protein